MTGIERRGQGGFWSGEEEREAAQWGEGSWSGKFSKLYQWEYAQMRVNQFQIQYFVIVHLQLSMFYFAYPNYLLPNAQQWFLPSAEFAPIASTPQEEQNLIFCKQTLTDTILVKQCADDMKQVDQTPQTPRFEKIPQKHKNISKDEDYHPEVYVCKKSKKSQQLENRNVVPNIIRLILSFIQKRGKSQQVVDKIFARSSTEEGWSVKRFYLYQALIRGKMNNYVNEDTLRQLVRPRPEEHALYSPHEQQFYNTVTRTLVDYFLREEIAVCVLTSKRMDRTKKTHHLVALRSIRQALPLLMRA